MEFNKEANHAANCAIHGAGAVDSLRDADVLHHMKDAVANGGLANGGGAAALILVKICRTEVGLQPDLIGARGTIEQGPTSAFHMEVTALDLATQYIIELCDSSEIPLQFESSNELELKPLHVSES